MTKYTVIDGKNFYFMFLAGAKCLVDNYAYLNKINVFPVPDGDTGTNMASTIQAIVDNVKPTKRINKTMFAIADAALVGARGNSGIIVAQFLQGLSNELEKYEKIDVITFAKVINKAVDYTYTALANPVEGTILTVLRVWSDFITYTIEKTDDFIELISQSYQKALEALESTQKQLSNLTKAGVVDAGAQGFIFFLKGMMNFSTEGNLKELVGSRQSSLIDMNMIDVHEEVTLRYCTEVLAIGDDLDKEALKKQISEYGNSVVIAGTAKKIRVHVHSDYPEKVIHYLSEIAQIESTKVDDMVFQNEIREHRMHDIAIVIDSSADIPDELMAKYQMHFIPLQVQLDKNIYLDRITLKHDDFYDWQASDKIYPKTSLPSLKDIQNKLTYLASFYKAIIVLNVSSGLSGTWQACSDIGKKIQKQTGVPIEVIDTKTLAGAQGLVAVRVAKALDQGVSFEDLKRLIPAWCKLSNVYAITKTIKYFVKGGRISKFKGFMASLFGVVPVVTPDKDGKGSILMKSTSQQRSID
ncbi:MAG: DegV family protein, partial [Bacteroidales bacterium]